jgi:hypothetical protein
MPYCFPSEWWDKPLDDVPQSVLEERAVCMIEIVFRTLYHGSNEWMAVAWNWRV